MFCFGNICLKGTGAHIQNLINRGVIESFVEILRNINEPILLEISLKAIETILSPGKIVLEGFYIEKIMQIIGSDVIEQLHNHPEKSIAEMAKRITDSHFLNK